MLVARLIDLALRRRPAAEQARLPVEHALGERDLGPGLLESLHRGDQIGLRLDHFRAVDLEQRIAAPHHVAQLGQQPRHAAGERGEHDCAGVFIEGDLAHRRLLHAERIRVHLDDIELLQLPVVHPNLVGAFARALRWPVGHAVVAGAEGEQHERGRHRPSRMRRPARARAAMDGHCHCRASEPEATTGGRFHQPPPSAWNRATMSASRADLACTRASDVSRWAACAASRTGRLTWPCSTCRLTRSMLRDADCSAAAAALTARESACSARSVSATFWNAVRTTLRYCAVAWLKLSSAARCLFASAPASNTTCAASPAIIQKPVPGENSFDIASAVLPALPLSVILGRRLASATPIWALAVCRFASAARTSGRWRTMSAGRLTGKARGGRKDLISNVAAMSSLGNRPVRKARRSRCCANCFSSGDSSRRAWATAVSCAVTSISAIWPRSYWRFRMSSSRVWMPISRRVAAICPRSDPSWMAASAMLAVKVKYTPSRWNAWASVSASAASISRRVPPKTSAT